MPRMPASPTPMKSQHLRSAVTCLACNGTHLHQQAYRAQPVLSAHVRICWKAGRVRHNDQPQKTPEPEKKLIDTAQAAPNTVILAQDEASLYLQATLQVVWHARGQTPVVKVDPGRDMVHFYGALNLHNGQEIAMMSPVMNAETTALYLQKLLLAYPDQPLLLLWDRAPWHKGTPIRELLQANPRLELLAFPPGAPDLNPQEHVWKATRAAISHNHRIPRLQPLADLFLRHLTHTTFHSSLLELHGFHIICPMFT